MEAVMNPIRIIRHSAGILAGLAGALLASIITASAAFASTSAHLPPLPPGLNKHPPLTPAHVHTALAAGMPGWQIALIAVGAAVLAAVFAVFLSRARAARRHVTASAA
jgi:ABC-type antimicrobial peptide transport system permease subunit